MRARLVPPRRKCPVNHILIRPKLPPLPPQRELPAVLGRERAREGTATRGDAETPNGAGSLSASGGPPAVLGIPGSDEKKECSGWGGPAVAARPPYCSPLLLPRAPNAPVLFLTLCSVLSPTIPAPPNLASRLHRGHCCHCCHSRDLHPGCLCVGLREAPPGGHALCLLGLGRRLGWTPVPPPPGPGTTCKALVGEDGVTRQICLGTRGAGAQ